MSNISSYLNSLIRILLTRDNPRMNNYKIMAKYNHIKVLHFSPSKDFLSFSKKDVATLNVITYI